jgi:hypothetical protein
VGSERIVGHQSVRDLFCERKRQSARDVDFGQFLVLTLAVGFDFPSLDIEFSPFGSRVCEESRYKISYGGRGGVSPGASPANCWLPGARQRLRIPNQLAYSGSWLAQ